MATLGLPFAILPTSVPSWVSDSITSPSTAVSPRKFGVLRSLLPSTISTPFPLWGTKFSEGRTTMRQCRIFLMPDGEEWPTTLWEKLKSISHFWWAGGNGAALVVNEYSADIVRTELGACIESTVD